MSLSGRNIDSGGSKEHLESIVIPSSILASYKLKLQNLDHDYNM